jgi:hypothetical protein
VAVSCIDGGNPEYTDKTTELSEVADKLQPFIEKVKFMTMFVSKVIAPFGEIRFHNLYFLCLKQFSQLVNKLSNTICIHYYESAS